MMIRKACNLELGELEVKKADSGEVGIFSGYAATFGNRDRDNDIIEKGAFGKSLRPSEVKLLWQHSTSEPIGVWREIREDDKGLAVKGELNLEVQRGREAYALMKQGALGEMSIGFKIPKGGSVEKEVGDGPAKRKVRFINEIKLYEISVVSIPVNPRARILEVKSADGRLPSERDFEAWLIDQAGLTSSEAATVVAKGYRHLVTPEGERSLREASPGRVERALEQRQVSELLELLGAFKAELSSTNPNR